MMMTTSLTFSNSENEEEKKGNALSYKFLLKLYSVYLMCKYKIIAVCGRYDKHMLDMKLVLNNN